LLSGNPSSPPLACHRDARRKHRAAETSERSNMTKKHRIVTLLALLVTLTATLVGTSAQADDFTNIRNYATKGQCLDVDTHTKLYVQIWSCDNGSDEKWSHTFIGTDASGNNTLVFTNQMTNQCLGVNHNATAMQSRLVVLQCDSASTLWALIYANNENLDGWHQQFRNVNSGLCLDVNGAGLFGRNGLPAQLWQCTNQLEEFDGDQLWML
jgi:hypothetical protein